MHSITTPKRLLRDAAAATYTGSAPTTLRAYRFHDRQVLEAVTDQLRTRAPTLHRKVVTGEMHPVDAAVSAGIEPPRMKGPRWIQIGRNVAYDIRDLDVWIELQKAAVMAREHLRQEPRGAVRRKIEAAAP